MQMIRVMLADDHPAFRAGVRSQIEKETDMTVIEEVDNGRDAVEQATKLLPDVLVLDIEIPFVNGIEVARQLHSRDLGIRILPLSGFGSPEYVIGILESGADGYVTKDESLSDIIQAIRKVMKGGVYISSRVAIEIVNQERRKSRRLSEQERIRAKLESLGMTPTLLRIVKLIARGFTNAEIAEIVSRSEHTIRNHFDRLKTLTGVKWRPALVAWCWRNGVMQLRTEDDADEEGTGPSTKGPLLD